MMVGARSGPRIHAVAALPRQYQTGAVTTGAPVFGCCRRVVDRCRHDLSLCFNSWRTRCDRRLGIVDRRRVGRHDLSISR